MNPFNITFIVLVLLSAQYATAQNDQAAASPPEQDKRNLRVSPGMAIVLICLITAFFLMGFISVYVRQCAQRRLSDDTDTEGTGIFTRSGRMRGLDQIIINTFPTFLYSDVKGHKIGQRALECAVCLLEFQDDEILRLLPKCNHVFHPNCIDAWLAFHVTCPVCRANLVPRPGDQVSPVTTTLCHDSENNFTESTNSPTRLVATHSVHSAQVAVDIDNPIEPTSTPRQARKTGKFPRSHSTGHSVVQPGENVERFTLRLPEDVRSQLVGHSFSRSTSAVSFARARSSRKGFRSISVGTGRGKSYERFDGYGRSGSSGRWNFSMTPPFISRNGSVRSASGVGEVDMTVTPRSLMKSIKSPLDRLFRGTDKDDVGERSTDKLRPDSGT